MGNIVCCHTEAPEPGNNASDHCDLVHAVDDEAPLRDRSGVLSHDLEAEHMLGTMSQHRLGTMSQHCRITVQMPLRPRAYTHLLDGLIEIGQDNVVIDLPDGVDADVAKLYVDFVSNPCELPFPTTHRDLAVMRRKWAAVDDFFGGSLRQYPASAWLSELHLASNALGERAMIDHVRRHCVFNKHRFEGDEYRFLIHATDVLTAELSFDAEAHRLRDADIDVTRCAFVGVPDARPPVASWPSVRKACEQLLKIEMPWFCTTYVTKRYGIVVAGGRLVAGLYDRSIPGQDTDIFIVAPSAALALLAANETIAAVQERFRSHKIVVEHTEHVTNMYVTHATLGSHKFQIIRAAFPSPSHVVHGFDVDVCGILFDGRDVYCTPNACRAVANGLNLYDQNKLSTTAEHRYAKYAINYGLRVLVVGLPQRLIDEAISHAIKLPKSASRPWESRMLLDAVRKRSALTAHDVSGLLAHIVRIRSCSRRTRRDPSDYIDILEKHYFRKGALKPSDFHVVGTDKQVFTGAFHPIAADTLMRIDEYMGGTPE